MQGDISLRFICYNERNESMATLIETSQLDRDRSIDLSDAFEKGIEDVLFILQEKGIDVNRMYI